MRASKQKERERVKGRTSVGSLSFARSHSFSNQHSPSSSRPQDTYTHYAEDRHTQTESERKTKSAIGRATPISFFSLVFSRFLPFSLLSTVLAERQETHCMINANKIVHRKAEREREKRDRYYSSLSPLLSPSLLFSLLSLSLLSLFLPALTATSFLAVTNVDEGTKERENRLWKLT